MRKALLLSLLLLSLPLMSVASPTQAPTSRYQEDFVPWPWGAESPFPWQLIQGFWASYSPMGRISFFTFRPVVIGGQTGLLIQQVEPMTCEVRLAGYAVANGKILRGRLDGVRERVLPQLIELRSFPEASVRGEGLPPALAGQRLVLSVSTSGAPVSHWAMQKISADPVHWCFRNLRRQ